MESAKETKVVILRLSNDEAIVLFEWLSNFNSEEHFALFHDKAEQRVLFDLESILENVLSETFEEDYKYILAKARKKIRDVDE